MARELALIALVAACGRDAPPPPRGEPLAAKSSYRIDAAPQPACTAGATCEVKLVVTALGDYHINEQYPFKFIADGVDATFTHDTAKTGTMTVRFHAAKPGTTKLVGTFKLCVCTDDDCEIETPNVALEVSVG